MSAYDYPQFNRCNSGHLKLHPHDIARPSAPLPRPAQPCSQLSESGLARQSFRNRRVSLCAFFVIFVPFVVCCGHSIDPAPGNYRQSESPPPYASARLRARPSGRAAAAADSPANLVNIMCIIIIAGQLLIQKSRKCKPAESDKPQAA